MEKINISPDFVTFSEEEKMNVIKCLDDNDTSIFVSKLIPRFQNKLADYLKVKHTIALPNCTVALYTAFNTLALHKNNEVLVPNLTHASSIYPIIMNNLKIKVYDFEPDSYFIDINHLESLITDKTKCILVCYLYGLPTNTDKVKAVCQKHNLYLIEDAAQGFGIKINGKYSGTFGDIGCLSFNDTKVFRIGEGGAILTDNSEYIEKIDLIRHVGEQFASNGKSTISSNVKYGEILTKGLQNRGDGFNFRASPITFATGEIKFKYIDNIIDQRQQKLRKYYENLKDIKGIRFIRNYDDNKLGDTAPIAAWILIDETVFDRNKVIIGCLNMGIPIGSFKYPTINKNSYFKKFLLNKKEMLNNSENIRRNSLFLPLYENVSLEDVEKIAEVFAYVIGEYHKKNTNVFDRRVLNEEISYFDGFYLMKLEGDNTHEE